jgi:hypothetical protein
MFAMIPFSFVVNDTQIYKHPTKLATFQLTIFTVIDERMLLADERQANG